LTAARADTGVPFAVRTDLVRATPLPGVEGAAPVPVLLAGGLGDVAPFAGELRPDVPDVGVFFGIDVMCVSICALFGSVVVE
jgi:hypothetical protein